MRAKCIKMIQVCWQLSGQSGVILTQMYEWKMNVLSGKNDCPVRLSVRLVDFK